MRKGIVISSWYGGREPLENLFASLVGVEYPIFLWINGGGHGDWEWVLTPDWNHDIVVDIHINQEDNFELGAIQGAIEHFDEFVLIQDSVEIINQDIFRILLDDYEGKSVAYNPHFQMYLGKYRKAILDQMVIEIPITKVESVRFEETFSKYYRQLDPNTVVFNGHFVDENFYGSWEERFGRKNLVLRDDYIIKRKGTWEASQLL